jgi:hypothetical protein
VIYGIWSLDQGDCKAISKEIKTDFAMDLCYPNTNKTQTQNKLKSMSTLLQTNLNECNDLLVSLTQVTPRNYMLHTFAGKFLKSLYFWLLENPGCYSLCYELEYSHVDIFMIYELEYSPYVMFMSYLAECFIVHTMFMNRFRLMLRWWFIMLLGMPKSFTCRSVESGTEGGFGWFLCMRARWPDM